MREHICAADGGVVRATRIHVVIEHVQAHRAGEPLRIERRAAFGVFEKERLRVARRRIERTEQFREPLRRSDRTRARGHRRTRAVATRREQRLQIGEVRCVIGDERRGRHRRGGRDGRARGGRVDHARRNEPVRPVEERVDGARPRACGMLERDRIRCAARTLDERAARLERALVEICIEEPRLRATPQRQTEPGEIGAVKAAKVRHQPVAVRGQKPRCHRRPRGPCVGRGWVREASHAVSRQDDGKERRLRIPRRRCGGRQQHARSEQYQNDESLEAHRAVLRSSSA